MFRPMTAEGRHTFEVAGREIEFFCKPAKRASAPVLFILHGHNHAAAPSSFRSEEYHVVCPMDRFGVNQAGSWWLGEDGDFFWIEAMASLVKAFRDSGAGDIYFWGSSMGGWGAILHGYLNHAKAVYANIPQTVLLGSSYAEKAGMKKYFQMIPGNRESEFNDLKHVVKEDRCQYFLCFNQLEKHDYFKEQGLAFVSHLNEIGARFYLEVRPQDTHGKNHGIQESVFLFEKYSVDSIINASENPMTSEHKAVHLSVNECPMCGDSLREVEAGQNCKGCGCRARLRSMVPVVEQFLGKEMPELTVAVQPLLGFAMTGPERKILAKLFKNFKSASLFGNYSSEHESGVDMRDLSRYAGNTFCGVFGCLLFDYFPEHERALQECFRVIAPGGVFITHIAPYRLLDGNAEPALKGAIKSRPGYFDYLPDKTELPDVRVGRDWFLDAMNRVGFATTLLKVQDAAPGMVSEWFIGIKPGPIASVSDTKQREQPQVKPVITRNSVAFQSVIPFGASGLANLKFELIESTSASLIFLEDHQVPAPDGGGEVREVVATNGSRNRLLVSRDLGESWTPQWPGIEFDSKIRAAFSLSDGGRIVRTLSGRMHHLDAWGKLVRVQETGPWPWHGSQGIGESRNGTVMYAEYAPLRVEDGTQDVSVWRYRPRQSEDGWQKVLTLPAAARPPLGLLRHFHVCRPNPGRPDEWVLASGDIGEHCRLWLSVDDGSTWNEVLLPDPIIGDAPHASMPRVLRFTQFSTLANGDLIWGTDDTTHAGRAALIRLSLASGRPEFFHEGWLGKNCVRNIASCNGQTFLLLSESKHDKSSADCIVYDATTGRLTSLLLPNLGQTSQTVTDSLGSASLLGGVGFFPASGAVLMDPAKRGLFRVSIMEIVK